jgi:NADH-quinone oxidoreductase subunit G
MEFLLINHPLDCPICDQGGECELQDLAMGYGRDVSRFTEKKRVIKDKDIGPLVQTDMTRCIHCTRCVRFGEEIAGLRELGATGRSEHMEIGTYVEKSMVSELSGNVIDLCPVGALTSKPFRFSARAWEMVQRPSIAPHDCVGSNIHLHIKNNDVKRVVPAENEDINEVWLSDRDRFSYLGLGSPDRLLAPMIRENGEWREVDWEIALDVARDRLRAVILDHGAAAAGALAAPSATLEELYLLQKLMRGLGSGNIDHRLRQADFSDDEQAPIFPWLGQRIAGLERADAVLLVGSYARKEQPLLNYRLRKAARRGASIMLLNMADYDFNFPVAAKIIAPPSALERSLAGIVKAQLESDGAGAPEALRRLLAGITPDATQRAIAEKLKTAHAGAVLLGVQVMAHPHYSMLRALAGHLVELTGARFGYLSEAANSSGAWLAGAVPHRDPAGRPVSSPGLNARAMLEQKLKAYVLLGVEPELDCWDPAAARAALREAGCVVALTAFRGPEMERYAHVLLPTALFAEMSGTFVNVEGVAQSFAAGVTPPGLARPGWKILRVLGNRLDLDGFDYATDAAVREEVLALIKNCEPDNRLLWRLPDSLPELATGAIERISYMPTNSLDPLVRRAYALQQTADVADGRARVPPAVADRLQLKDGDRARVQQGAAAVELSVVIDNSVPPNCVLIHAGHPAVADLGGWFSAITLQRARA